MSRGWDSKDGSGTLTGSSKDRNVEDFVFNPFCVFPMMFTGVQTFLAVAQMCIDFAGWAFRLWIQTFDC